MAILFKVAKFHIDGRRKTSKLGKIGPYEIKKIDDMLTQINLKMLWTTWR